MQIFKRNAFTLAEVLIVIAIVGIIAAMTLPALIIKIQNAEFKTAYKKAYSDISQAFLPSFVEGGFIRKTIFQNEATTQEFGIMKEKFKVMLDCGTTISKCWGEGEYLTPKELKVPANGVSSCFMDINGRSWCAYSLSENLFLVDTNGVKRPNEYGKDRWVFTFVKNDGTRSNNAGDYNAIGNWSKDVLISNWTCHYPPCYFKSWLTE